ncbi:MAG: acyl-ACP--UDP-N-acetylglucosamine O-acyltransferase [Saprospiraceae bacterium]|nr:acyl-ACP--UDP-N-acetylglucosamine O-acyltransferase [Saprospiraceae bacterium]
MNLVSIHPKAKIGNNVRIEPFVTIEEDVVIGDNTWIGSHAVIMNGTRMGENCKIFPGAVVGAAPQDLKFKNENTTLEIGNNVTIREYCTINKGTTANYSTIIGDNCLLMAYVHVAHDCVIEQNCILANNVTLAGHIHIGKYATLGGLVAVHQFVRIGDYVYIGGSSLVRKDIPPFIKAAREPLSYVGINSVGLKRRGFTIEQVHSIQDIYRILFIKKGFNTRTALEHIAIEIEPSPERDYILDFVKHADRGIIRGLRQLNGSYQE